MLKCALLAGSNWRFVDYFDGRGSLFGELAGSARYEGYLRPVHNDWYSGIVLDYGLHLNFDSGNPVDNYPGMPDSGG